MSVTSEIDQYEPERIVIEDFFYMISFCAAFTICDVLYVLQTAHFSFHYSTALFYVR